MKLLVDMNLSPEWVEVFERHGWSAAHWSVIGDPRATDRTILEWARDRGYVVVTHDLDFGAVLATTGAGGPSVVQIRTQDVLPSALERTLVAVLRKHEALLEAGALISVDDAESRVRILPL